MYDEYDFTLEDAMGAVDELIEERAARGAHKKFIASRANKIKAIDDQIAKLKNVVKTAENSDLKATLLDKIGKLELERDHLNISASAQTPAGPVGTLDLTDADNFLNGPSKHNKERSESPYRNIISQYKGAFGAGKKYMPIDRKPGHYLNLQNKKKRDAENKKKRDVVKKRFKEQLSQDLNGTIKAGQSSVDEFNEFIEKSKRELKEMERRELEKKAAIKKNIATGGKVGGAGLGAAGAGASAVKINNLRKELKALKLKAKSKKGLTEDEEKRVKQLKKQIAGYGAAGAASAGLGIASGVSAYKDFKGKAVKESVDEYRLNVFEAYESGLIDEDEKDIMLEMLDLENYE